MHTHSCAHCARLFESKYRDAKFCGTSCRVTVHRQRMERRRKDAEALLARQTDAIVAGADPVVLAALAREARRLLGH